MLTLLLLIVLPIILLYNLPSSGGSSPRYSTYRESYLRSMGYKVGKSGLSKKARQDMLRNAVASGNMTKRDAINNLERNISMFQYKNNMGQSISDWAEDLDYVKRHL